VSLCLLTHQSERLSTTVEKQPRSTTASTTQLSCIHTQQPATHHTTTPNTLSPSLPPTNQVQGLKLLAALLPQQPCIAAAAAVLRLCPSILTRAAPDARLQQFEMLRDSWQRLEAAAVTTAAAAATAGGGGGGGDGAPGSAGRGKKRAREGDDEQGDRQLGSQEVGGSAAANSANGGGVDNARAMQARIEAALFVMLGDESPEVAARAAEFWHAVLPRTPGARMAVLLERAKTAGVFAAGGWVASSLSAVGGWEGGGGGCLFGASMRCWLCLTIDHVY